MLDLVCAMIGSECHRIRILQIEFFVSEVMAYIGWLLVGLIVGGVATSYALKHFSFSDDGDSTVAALLRSHFHPISTSDITISEREFPFRGVTTSGGDGSDDGVPDEYTVLATKLQSDSRRFYDHFAEFWRQTCKVAHERNQGVCLNSLLSKRFQWYGWWSQCFSEEERTMLSESFDRRPKQ